LAIPIEVDVSVHHHVSLMTMPNDVEWTSANDVHHRLLDVWYPLLDVQLHHRDVCRRRRDVIENVNGRRNVKETETMNALAIERRIESENTETKTRAEIETETETETESETETEIEIEIVEVTHGTIKTIETKKGTELALVKILSMETNMNNSNNNNSNIINNNTKMIPH
jgi:hypothetical protein